MPGLKVMGKLRIYNSASVSQADCIFCKICDGRSPSHKVFEDGEHIAFLDINPFAPGHTLVCPKEHGETLWEMGEAEIGRLFATASRVSLAVVSAMKADGFRILQNNGEAANQVVAHVHVHVIPNKLQDKGRFLERHRLGEEEMNRIAAEIAAEMAKGA